MRVTVILNWKSFAALSLGAFGVSLVRKMSPEQAKEVTTHVVDTCKLFVFQKKTA